MLATAQFGFHWISPQPKKKVIAQSTYSNEQVKKKNATSPLGYKSLNWLSKIKIKGRRKQSIERNVGGILHLFFALLLHISRTLLLIISPTKRKVVMIGNV